MGACELGLGAAGGWGFTPRFRFLEDKTPLLEAPSVGMAPDNYGPTEMSGETLVQPTDEDAKGWVKEPPWLSSQLDLLAPVAAMGFPYGMQRDAQGSTSLLRAFSGHVVSGRRYLPPGMKPPAFDAYELSFAVPRGLSGAPLLDYRTADSTTAVSGIVIGNGRESMLVHTQTEKDKATKETVVVERWESLQLGIAVQASCVLSTRSTLLGRTIGEHLEERRLVLDRQIDPGQGS